MKMALFQEDANNTHKLTQRKRAVCVKYMCCTMTYVMRSFSFVVLCLVLTLYS